MLPELEDIGKSFLSDDTFYILYSFYRPKYRIALSIEEVKITEKETKEQAKVKKWFLYRAGRVTASNFKSYRRKKVEAPSLSLIKRICYPSTFKLKIISLWM